MPDPIETRPCHPLHVPREWLDSRELEIQSSDWVTHIVDGDFGRVVERRRRTWGPHGSPAHIIIQWQSEAGEWAHMGDELTVVASPDGWQPDRNEPSDWPEVEADYEPETRD